MLLMIMLLGLVPVAAVSGAGLAALGKLDVEKEFTIFGYDIALEMTEKTPLELSVNKQ